jgi:hypothetical protein
MFKKVVLKLTIATSLLATAAPAIHASTTTPPSASSQPTLTADGVTGGDPEPTSPNIVQIVLQLLQLA